jgi:hypothetical protein
MNFMVSEEYLLLMNLGRHMLQGTPVLSIPERMRLKEVGIETAIEYPEWADMEVVRGEYAFSSIENILCMNREVGMKTILAIPNCWLPTWFPDEWRPKHLDGRYNTAALSIFNKEAMKYEQDFFKMLVDKYTAPDVMFILQEHDTGESAFPNYFFYEDCAKEDFYSVYDKDVVMDLNNSETRVWLEDAIINHFLDLQRIFYPPYKEIWNSLQWLIAKLNPPSMNYLQPRILESFQKEFVDANIVLLQYTYFDDSHPQENVEYVDMLKEKYCKDVIVEAMFCAGLPTTTPRSIAKGFRGQIICPVHPHTHESGLHEWMVDAIAQSNRLWKESKGI